MNRKNLYVPREISWVEFNKRVLYEAKRPEVPLLEKLKFLSIVSSNFDEFFMVRVASLKRQVLEGEDRVTCPSGVKPSQQLNEVRQMVRQCQEEQYSLLRDVLSELDKEGLVFSGIKDFNQKQRSFVDSLFHNELFSILSPIRLDYKKNLPVIQNLGLNIAFLVQKEDELPKLAILQIPSSQSRIIWLPDQEGKSCFTLVEEVIKYRAVAFFPGYSVLESCAFRLTKDADLEVDEEKGDDFVEAMEEILINRLHSKPVRMEIEKKEGEIKEYLIDLFELDEHTIYSFHGPLNLKDFISLASISSYDSLKYPDWKSVNTLDSEQDIWSQISEQDILLHHPYDSFKPVVRMVQEAADDSSVLSIKMTLYRTSGDSPLVKALKKAALNGIQVIVLVELKARFDEARNILWARELERAGVIVIYGLVQLKVHSKALMIIRRESHGIRRYVHLGTGNYNDKTAKLYTDLGLISCRDDLTYEVSLFFNTITGYSVIPKFRYLWMSPDGIKTKVLQLIETVANASAAGSPGLIMVKMNALAHPVVIQALYSASQKGVKILLNIRGICMLKPGIPGISDNIKVVSIIDRYLEHSRIFYFQHGSREDLYLSSADWMPRNLEKRVEIMFPILNPNLRSRVRGVLEACFKDNQKSFISLSDGSYKPRSPEGKEPPFRVQEALYKDAKNRKRMTTDSTKKNIKVRRKPPLLPT